MIKKLQKKFITITAAALFIIILSVMAAVNGIFFYQINKMLDSRLERMISDHTHFPKTANAAILPRLGDHLKIRLDECLVFLDENGVITEILQDRAENYSEKELSEIAFEIYSGEKEYGWHGYYKYSKKTLLFADGTPRTVIGLINASSGLYSVFTMLLISTVIGILSFLLILLIIILASKHAVKPIAESYRKQKQFVTDAGHELKTPLTVISANNELLRMLYGESEWFDSIDKQVTKLNGLVQNLITLAKMDEEQRLVFTSFLLSDAVYDTAKSFENLIHSQKRFISFSITEGIICTGDEARLREAISILMDNAVKYCDEKSTITVVLKAGRQIHLQVTNDCHSAADCDFGKVFERFYRADKARSSDGSFGLGLSIAKSIVELHKGEIHAKLLENNRVMFEITLPR